MNATWPKKETTPTFPTTLQKPGLQPPSLKRKAFSLVDLNIAYRGWSSSPNLSSLKNTARK